MDNHIILIILIIIILFMYYNFLYTENFLDQVCLFEPSNPPTWGEETINSMEGKLALKSKDKCIIACSKLPDCNTEECIKKCSECVDFNKC